MPGIGRRSARAASLAVLVGVAAVLFSAPAFASSAAAAAADPRTSCSAPIDGTTACLVWRQGDDGTAWLSGTVSAADGRTLKAALVAVEGCGGACHAQVSAVGQNTTGLTTGEIPYGRGTGYYRVNATWIDDKLVMHTVVDPDYS